ncbi:MAG: hypothetical protein MZV49_24595 [Rhodopseudomonas palustris]|nr:hypothetical protein [Rhodopseudomonas palustris]
MDWDKLKVFHAAAEAGSFTHAGEQLDWRIRGVASGERAGTGARQSRCFIAMPAG